jgi:3-phenylpropionate/trans-cinnamate dioxygenase ferredoxin subunit
VAEHRIPGAAKLPCGEAQHADVEGLPICLVRAADGAYFAISDLCSHEDSPLSDGWVYERKIECALHGSVFDLETGAAVSLPATEPIETYPVEADGDDLVVRLCGHAAEQS